MDTSVICTGCGEPVDASIDKPGVRSPCPKCGSTHRSIQVAALPGLPTNYALDHFVAQGLSSLTECGAPEIPDSGRSWLGPYTLVVEFNNLPDSDRAYRLNFLRRTEGALLAYDDARTALLYYLKAPRVAISAYFRALLQFEICVSQIYQGLELLRAKTDRNIYDPAHRNNRSIGRRLHDTYIASKHLDGTIKSRKVPLDATSALWITNASLESCRSSLTFADSAMRS